MLGSIEGSRNKIQKNNSVGLKRSLIYMDKKKITLGVIVGTRGFFNPELAAAGRASLSGGKVYVVAAPRILP